MMTKAQREALNWLLARGADGAFVRGGSTIIAQGEIAPMERKTWNALAEAELIEYYGGASTGGKGYGRARITDKGREQISPRAPKATADPNNDWFGSGGRRNYALPGAE